MILSGDSGEVNEDVRDVLTDVLVAVERQIRLVNELLDISKIEAGAMNFRLSDAIQIDQVAQLLVTSMETVAREQNIEIKMRLPKEPLPPVQADHDKISQVLINLVTNAVKFTQEGAVEISFNQKKDFVIVCVTDTGTGIPQKQRGLLFRKFSKPTASSVGTISAGSGLGLYISKKFVERQGGDIWLEKSDPGTGSTFCFSLPISHSKKAKEVKESVSPLQTLKGGPYEQNIIDRR
jgi:signal transduction histidine kinase